METFMYDIKFNAQDCEIICHTRYLNKAAEIKNLLGPYNLKNHLVIFSSGTTSHFPKGYALSKEALFANAEAVNRHFDLTKNDIWALSIPHFHIGGLSVILRAKLLGSKLIATGVWSPLEWAKQLNENKVTITTVVPTQVYDLVQFNIQAPQNLKYLVVGGDLLSLSLEEKARELGWPIVRTFGMTEVCSQIASGNPKGELEVLPIHKIKSLDQKLFIKSPALFTLQFVLKNELELTWARDYLDNEGFYPTQDLVEITGNSLRHLGRIDDQIKINGRLISFFELKEKFSEFVIQKQLFGQMELINEDDDRQGKKIVIQHVNEIPNSEELNNLFSPHPIEFKKVNRFDRTDLGKLKRT